MILIDQSAGPLTKYLYQGNVNTEEIKKFLDDWKNKKLEKWLKSEDVPASNDAPVKVIVGKTFAEIVRDSTDDVLVEFYAPWCGHCKALAPKYDQLAEELKNVKGLVIAKVDATANEIEGVQIKGFPTLKFFKNGSKRQPIDYSGEREVDGFKNGLAENSEAYKNHLSKKEDL